MAKTPRELLRNCAAAMYGDEKRPETMVCVMDRQDRDSVAVRDETGWKKQRIIPVNRAICNQAKSEVGGEWRDLPAWDGAEQSLYCEASIDLQDMYVRNGEHLDAIGAKPDLAALPEPDD